MKYNILGKTGLNVSKLGFGGIPIQRIDAEGTRVLMHKMKDRGINFIDSARGYTVSEEILYFLNPRLASNFWIPQNRPFAMTIGTHDFYT